MNAVNKLLTLLIFVLLGLTSCSKNDPKTEHTFNGSYVSTSKVVGVVTTEPLTIPGDNKSIDSMYAGIDYAKPITSGELSYNKSYIELVGLTAKGATLTNFTVIINGVERNFGNVSADFNLSTKEALDFLNSGLIKVVQQQRLEVKMRFTSSDPILETDNVNLKINFDGVFKYMK